MQPPAISSSSGWLRGVVHIFAAQGVDTPRLFGEAGLDISRLEQPHMRFTAAEVNRLWSLAVTASGQPALGIDRPLAQRHINYDLAAQAMWPSPYLRGGLESLSRYLHLIGDAAEFTLQPELGGAWVTLVHGNDAHTPRQRVEFGLLTFFLLCRRVAHTPLRPRAVEFTAEEPADFHPYRMAFAAPLRFGQQANRMLLADEDLALPLPAAASLFAVQEQVLEDLLARRGHQRFSYRAGEEMVRRLHLGEPRPAEIARNLSLAEPTLHQRLRAEGNSFERLLEDVRHDLASHYLAQPAYPMTRLPALLGYSSAPLFHTACKRWFGAAPAACRHLLLGDRAAAH
jgi:AraC-like DNA-binding protein